MRPPKRKKRSHQRTQEDLSVPYGQATTSNLYLDRIGGPNEFEPKFLRKISDYLLKMGAITTESSRISESEIRSIVREEIEKIS